MPRTLPPSSLEPEQPLGVYKPQYPTAVVASYKGGTWKTSIALAMAERLALAGRHVLLITCDSQEDARARMGVRPTEPRVAYRYYGPSAPVSVVSLRGPKAVDFLYRVKPSELGISTYFEVVVVDTPPKVQAASLPGVMLVATIDGADAARNTVAALRRTPTNTNITLVHAGSADPKEWAQNVSTIGQALGRPVSHLPDPLPRIDAIAKAHSAAQSVWTIPRGNLDGTRQFLDGIDVLAKRLADQLQSRHDWPEVPPPEKCKPWVVWWDENR